MGNQQAIPKGELKTLASSTNFNDAELRKLHVEYQKLDADKSGELDLKEFTELLTNHIPVRPRTFPVFNPGTSPDTFSKLFHAFDADNSGTVSFKELATALSVISKGKPEEKLAYLFDVYDINGDATLDKDELNKIVEQMKTVAKELGRDEASINDFIAGLMKKIDKNGDGQVSKSEWIDGGLRSPSLLVLLGANQL